MAYPRFARSNVQILKANLNVKEDVVFIISKFTTQDSVKSEDKQRVGKDVCGIHKPLAQNVNLQILINGKGKYFQNGYEQVLHSRGCLSSIKQ